MPPSDAAHPRLYSAAPRPTLNGARCLSCGYVFFPPQPYGCEVCGAAGDKLQPVALRGTGRLSSFATVHLHQGKGIEAPFTVGVIELDEGPALRAILTERTDAGLRIGDRMRAVVVRGAPDDSGALGEELRFAKEDA